MSYKSNEITKFIIETETKAVIDSLSDLIERHVYLNGTVYDLLEIEDEKREEKVTKYIQNKIIENVKKSEEFKDFNLIFN